MSYAWRPESGAYTLAELEDEGLLHRFEDQGAAEEWLGIFYGDLLEHGVAEVSLYEEDRLIYGPMSLHP
ncbi:hypothetical protein BCR15_10805 [Tessaracoccus lapidicaptus]|uniref:Uncharacterized protein n=1 Tax=Tessaracoccus lapidicaptus TaxID=1427523 RepID=A0A1C0ASD1_9ACTN|nr:MULTISPECIES: hypothetical protein [Tessaracoccus]AQX16657.1 hypothetical protein BKM78_12615 [Tessaracoccus sp. T2.5-30]OCL37189.1 hypothetical protein BCR15_10805 [Tessaracoccus lapidicaptus]VEP41377.1 hypothetical protein TLA_TLA_02540 [Tessaracoccus lapidicaptus]